MCVLYRLIIMHIMLNWQVPLPRQVHNNMPIGIRRLYIRQHMQKVPSQLQPMYNRHQQPIDFMHTMYNAIIPNQRYMLFFMSNQHLSLN